MAKRVPDLEVQKGNATLYRLIAAENEMPLYKLIEMGPAALTEWLRSVGDTNNSNLLRNAREAGNLIVGFTEEFERELEQSQKEAKTAGASRLCPVKFE